MAFCVLRAGGIVSDRRDPCLEPFLRMVEGGVRLGELFHKYYMKDAVEALRRDSIFARLQEPRPRPLYFEVPRRAIEKGGST